MGGRCGRQDLRLILQELAHEAEVGRDHTPPLLDVIEGVLQVELLGLHEVSHADGGRAGDPSLTVDKDLAALFPDTVNEVYCFLKVGADVSGVAVFHGDPFVV